MRTLLTVVLVATAAFAIVPHAASAESCPVVTDHAYACLDTDDAWNSCVHVDGGADVMCRGPNNPPVPQI